MTGELKFGNDQAKKSWKSNKIATEIKRSIYK